MVEIKINTILESIVDLIELGYQDKLKDKDTKTPYSIPQCIGRLLDKMYKETKSFSDKSNIIIFTSSYRDSENYIIILKTITDVISYKLDEYKTEKEENITVRKLISYGRSSENSKNFFYNDFECYLVRKIVESIYEYNKKYVFGKYTFNKS